MKLSEAKRKYRKQWIAYQYTDKRKSNVRVLLHNKNLKLVEQTLLNRKKRPKEIGFVFAGPLIPKGVGILLPCA